MNDSYFTVYSDDYNKSVMLNSDEDNFDSRVVSIM